MPIFPDGAARSDIADAILTLPLRVGHHLLQLLNSRLDETFTRRRLSTKTPTTSSASSPNRTCCTSCRACSPRT